MIFDTDVNLLTTEMIGDTKVNEEVTDFTWADEAEVEQALLRPVLTSYEGYLGNSNLETKQPE